MMERNDEIVLSNQRRIRVAYVAVDYTVGFGGISHKINAQLRALEKGGLSCDIFFAKQKKSLFSKILRRLPLGSDGVPWNKLNIENYDAIYIRKPGYISREFVAFLAKLREKNKDAKIMLEIPTYPYDRELSNFFTYAQLIKDRINRKKLPQYIDQIFVCGNAEDIFGISTTGILNGIDLDRAKEKTTVCIKPDEINLVCVAAFASWHGIDRMLYGMKNYEESGGNVRITLNLLGEGPALQSLKRLAKELGLNNRVLFYGHCDQSKMDEVYDRCTLAIASLGLHRIGLSSASTLKTREYLAKGIPFLYSGIIDVFENEPVSFCLPVEADDSPINIPKLIEFHDFIYASSSQEEVISTIRQYAEENVSIEKTMADVVEYIWREC